MQWWNDFVDWFSSAAARPAIFDAVLLAVAIIVAGVLAALIARGAVRGMLTRVERRQQASAVAALIDAATEASVWSSLSPQEQLLSDRAVGQADILIRLLPVKGAGIAANWAAHQLADLKKNSSAHGPSLDPAVSEFRDRLVAWQFRPSRAQKIFQEDLQRWNYETTGADLADEPWMARSASSEDPAPAPAHSTETGPTATAAPEPAAPDTATQRLMNDVSALQARNADNADDETRASESTPPVPAFAASKPTGLEKQ